MALARGLERRDNADEASIQIPLPLAVLMYHCSLESEPLIQSRPIVSADGVHLSKNADSTDVIRM
jgi:hypothetical protein